MDRRAASACAAIDAEPQIVYPIGMMLIGTAVLAVPCYLAKQSQILCYIVVGALVGTIKGSSGCTWAEEMHLSTETAAALYDLGILFVLFMGGMEVDLQALKKAWKLVIINGMGQISLNLASFCILTMIASNALFEGKTTLELVSATGPTGRLVPLGVSTFFFGVCCTLSSTILVLGALKKRGEMATMHGQIILGLMVLQDVTAVLTIAVMVSAFNPNLPPSPIGTVLGGLIVWLIILPIFLYVVNRTVLDRVFSFFAKTRELLFICTFAYSLGVASLFGWFLPSLVGGMSESGFGGSFSQEIGIFFAGVSIAALPYRVQIETFVEPIRAFGVVLFFFILGTTLPLGSITAVPVILGVVLAILTLCVFPMFIWLTGLISGLDGKTAFMIGWIVNQVSEFSLIIGNMAYGWGVFTETMYLTIVIGTLITFVFSAMGHGKADEIYDGLVSKVLGCMKGTVEDDSKVHFEYHDHIVLLGFNEIALEISEFFREHEGLDVLVIQDNPDLHNVFEGLYKHGQAKIDLENPEGGKGGEGIDANSSRVATNIHSQYADPNNPDTWHHYELHAAAMVVSCQQGTTESDCVLAHDLAHPHGEGHHAVPFLCLSDSNAEARTMYEAGVRYVIQSESLAMHHHQTLDKETFMKDYINLHKADMEAEDQDPHRIKLKKYL